MKNFLKSMPTATVILLVFSLISFIWGSDQKRLAGGFNDLDITDISDSADFADYEGKTVFLTDTVKLEECSEDTEMGVKAQGYVLVRTVEMYQYMLDDDSVYKGFASTQKRDIKGLHGEKYTNPKFAADIKNATFFGKAVLEKSGKKLDDSYLNAFYTGDYTTLEKVNVKALDNLTLKGYKNCGEGYYTKANPDSWQIGDVRIRYTYIPEEELNEISICGVIKDGNVVAENALCSLASNMTQTKDALLAANVSGDHASSANGLFTVGIIEIAVAVIIYVVKLIRKKSV